MIGLYILGNFVLFLGGKIMRNTNSKIFLLILLGSLTAFGPLVTDMYLPSLPSMTDYFGTQASMVQLGLTSSMIGLALGQLFFGPLSDWYGRRPPLLVAMSLFIVSTVCCIFSATIEGFIFFRLIQGIAGAGGIVVSRSIATDRFTGKELAKAMAIIGAINGIAPVASPVLGGLTPSFPSFCLGMFPPRLYRLEGYFYRTVDSRSFVTVLQFTFQGVFIGG
ncbi:drug resistance transporter Bcr/CflA subfamily [Bacteroides sp. CAG:20]|nr:drug resistance transporter Bcr/CflA subfamily [Bacteroides sp. CAG:20]